MVRLREKQLKVLFRYWLYFRPTINNFFILIMDSFTGKILCTLSLGLSRLKGRAKRSEIAYRKIAEDLVEKLRSFTFIKTINVILTTRARWKLRMFLKPFSQKMNPRRSYRRGVSSVILPKHCKRELRFGYIYVLPKIAHNGCRRRKRKRR